MIAPVLLSHQQAGRLGEALAIAKIASLGLPVYASPEGAPGHDAIVLVDGRPLSIEIKTRQSSDTAKVDRWPVDWETKGGADLFLFVEIDLRTLVPTFRLLTNAQAKATHNGKGKGACSCSPALVRRAVAANDFSILTGAIRAPETAA